MASASAAHAPATNGNASKHDGENGGGAHHPHVDDASLRFASLAIHGGQRPDPVTGAIMPPISVSSTYVQVCIPRAQKMAAFCAVGWNTADLL